MSIKVNCDFCSKELDEQAGLIFGEPINKRPEKYHLCIVCTRQIEKWIKEERNNNKEKIS